MEAGELNLLGWFDEPSTSKWLELAEKTLRAKPVDALRADVGGIPTPGFFAGGQTIEGDPVEPAPVRPAKGPANGSPPWRIVQWLRGNHADDILDAVRSDAALDVTSWWASEAVEAEVRSDPAAWREWFAAAGEGSHWYVDGGHDPVSVVDAFLAHVPSGTRATFFADPCSQAGREGDDGAEEMQQLLIASKRLQGVGVRVDAFGIDGLPYAEAGGDAALELGLTLAAGFEMARRFSYSGYPLAGVARGASVRLASPLDPFEACARFRAFRWMWRRAWAGCGVSNARVSLHGVTDPRTWTRIDAWNNALRGTTSALGAAIGGVDSLTVLPHDAELTPSRRGSRLAALTQVLLQDESGVGHVRDPAGGAWYVEWLTHALCEASWEVFQRVQRAGGMRTVLGSGAVERWLSDAREARRERVASREHPVVGVNRYPAKDLPTVWSHVHEAGGWPRHRDAAAWERLRAEPGPLALIVALGPVSERRGMVGDAAELLSAGGFRVALGKLAKARGADLVLLVGGAERLEAEGRSAVKQARRIGARMVAAWRHDVDGARQVPSSRNAVVWLSELRRDLEGA